MKKVIIELILKDNADIDETALAEKISDELASMEVEGVIPPDVNYWTVEATEE